MPQFQQQQPPVGQIVTITLKTGEELQAEWDGLQWLVSMDNSPNAAPVVNDYVDSWSL